MQNDQGFLMGKKSEKRLQIAGKKKKQNNEIIAVCVDMKSMIN